MIKLLFAGVIIISSSLAWADMTPLEDVAMGEVTAREGIGFEWDLRINADENGDPLPGLSLVERRIAIQYANRADEWLVFKNVHGRINIPTFFLNANTFSMSPTPYADTSRFVSGLGVPVSPYGAQGLLFTFPEEIEFYNVTIGGMAVEYGAVPAVVDPNSPPDSGFFADPTDSRSFIGLRISNSIPGQPGTLRAEGNMTVFGF